MTITADMAKQRRSRRIPTAKQLCTLREKLGLTQEEMAGRFNVPRLTYQGWERNRATPPGPAAIVYEILLGSISQ